MVPASFVELHRLQVAAVIACKPLCLDVELREASTVRELHVAAIRTRRSLSSTRYLSTQCGPAASRPIYALTQPAIDALGDLCAACDEELRTMGEVEHAG